MREAKALFGLADEALAREIRDPHSKTPKWLGDGRVAQIVQEAIRYRNGKVYKLHRYVVMPNHVHLLIEPLTLETDGEERTFHELSSISGMLKRHSARQANRLLGRSGVFWQEESYDHWVRDEAEYARITRYIDDNPVQAGLCRSPGDWPWSSARDKRAG